MTASIATIVLPEPPPDPGERGIRALVDTIFVQLSAAGIPSCLLRNRDQIPLGLLQWSDLDILLPGKVERSHLITTLDQLVPASIVPFHDWLTVAYIPFEHLFLRVDFVHGERCWFGVPYTEAGVILTQRRDDRGIPVAATLHQAYVTLVEKALRGAIPKRYEALIEAAMVDDPAGLHRLLNDSLGSPLSDEVAEMIRSGRWADLQSKLPEIRDRLHARGLRRHPVRTLKAHAKQYLYGIRRRLFPSGLEVVVLGVDHTRTRAVCVAFANAPSRPVPGAYVEDGGREGQPSPWAADEHRGASGEGPVRLTAMLACQWRHRLIGDRMTRARMGFIFRDRHLLQLPIEPALFAWRGSTLAARLAARLAPRPDLLFVLDAPGGCHADAYRSLAGRVPHSWLIDGTQPVAQIMNDIIDVLRDYSTSRTRQRMTSMQGRRGAIGSRLAGRRHHAHPASP